MARTTKKDQTPSNVTVLEPPGTAEPEESEDPQAQSAADEESPVPDAADTTFEENATAEQIEKRRGRANHKEASAGFFARISAFPRAEWEKLLLYVYRIAPITDRRASGEPVNYIAKLSEPIDEDYILKEPNWGGSGKYRVRLNRTNADGKNMPVDVVEFTVENQKYPPRVAPGEWVDDPRNRRWAWAKTYDDGKEKPAADKTETQQNGSPKIGELIQAVKDLKELSKEAAPPPAPAPPDPVAQLNGTVDAVSKIVNLAKPPAQEKPAADPMLAFVLERLGKAEDRATMLLEKLLTPRSEDAKKPDDPLATMAIKLLEKRLEKMDEEPKASDTAELIRTRMNGTQELIAEVSKHLSPVLEKALGLFTIMATAKAQAMQPAQPGRPRTVDVTPHPAQPGETAPPPAEQQPATQESTPNPATPQHPTMEQAQQQVLNVVLGQATPTLQQYLRNPETSGSDFAAWFCDAGFSIPGVPPPFNAISGIDAHIFARQFGRDKIVAAYKSNTALYQQIAPNPEAEEQFVRFLDEFLAYDPNSEEGD